VAINLIEKGFDDDFICDITKLSVSEIKKIRMELKTNKIILFSFNLLSLFFIKTQQQNNEIFTLQSHYSER
ncbi:MAG: hypothetical protein EAZ06_09855, partial [Cytophagales bacterium]